MRADDSSLSCVRGREGCTLTRPLLEGERELAQPFPDDPHPLNCRFFVTGEGSVAFNSSAVSIHFKGF